MIIIGFIERIDRAEPQISASAADIYRAFLEPELLEKWLPPAGMPGKVHEIRPNNGGGYVMSLYHEETSPTVSGKTNEYEDRFRVIFDDLTALPITIESARTSQAG